MRRGARDLAGLATAPPEHTVIVLDRGSDEHRAVLRASLDPRARRRPRNGLGASRPHIGSPASRSPGDSYRPAMPIFDRKTISPHQHAEALKNLIKAREDIIRRIAKNDKVDAFAQSLYYVDHAIASLNGNQVQSGERVSYTDT
jgi:hypothetical protein